MLFSLHLRQYNLNKTLDMKQKRLMFVALSLFAMTVATQAQDASERTFLKPTDVANSLKLLPPPPQPGSAYFNYDEAQYRWGKMQRITPRGKQAFEDAKLGGEGISNAFSDAFGIKISSQTTPEIYKLIVRMQEDAGDLATRDAKNHYMRMRPFMFYGEQSLTPDDEKWLSTNGSYPSGHTSIGWATALVLAEINVARQDQILKRGFECGQSRVICGVHYQSDVDAGRVVGSALVARLHADAAFTAQLAKAKKEFARLVKEGKVKQAE